MKLKLSSMLLIGIALFVIGGIFTSGFMLRKKYDSLNTSNNPNWYYTKLIDAPFKHLKIAQNAQPDSLKNKGKDIEDVWGSLTFTQSDTFLVAANPSSTGYGDEKDKADTLSCKIMGDTLCINVPYHQFFFGNNNGGRRMSYDLHLKMPFLESITCANVSPYVLNFNQEKIDLVLTGQAHFIFENKDKNGNNKVKSMAYVKAQINDKAVLDLSQFTKINTLDLDIKDYSKISMPVLPADKLTLRAGDSTRIAAPSILFKKGIEK
jgi:hypothetical protein